jgi:hypothetical protein
MTPSRKPAQSEGGGFPQWLSELGIRPGGFYIETKARLVHAMTNRGWQDEPRVWACLALHTMAFQQELAVRMDKGALVPLRQIDIAKETGMDVRHVQRAVRNLEKQGSLQRQGETKGEVKLLCYAVPRRPKKDDVETAAPEQGSIYDGLPDELAVWLRKFKFGAPDQEKLNEALQEAREVALHVERLRALSKSSDSVKTFTVTKSTESHSRGPEKDAARGVQKPEMHAARQPKSTPRAGSAYKEEITERTTTREQASRQVVAAPACPPPDSPVWNVRKAILDSGICAKLNVTPDQKILERIAAKLNGASPDALCARIKIRLDSIRSLGVIEHLAADVAAAEGSPVATPGMSRTDAVKALAIRNLKRTGRIFA